MQKPLSVVKSVVDLVKSAYFNKSEVSNDESITFFSILDQRQRGKNKNKGKVEGEYVCIHVEVVNSVFNYRLAY